MSSLFAFLFSSKPKTHRPSFEKWAAATTQADIEELFLQVLKEGDADDGVGKSLSDEELAHFNHTVLSTVGNSSPNTFISPAIVISHLVACHPQHAKTIKSASTLLTRLVQAHASFPFPTNVSDDLTLSSVLQAILLLTANCEKLFGAAGWIGNAVTIRKRTPKQRISFMFLSLASSLATPSVDDVVDVLCRVPYPRIRDRTGDLRRRKAVDLTPVAERLLGHDSKTHQDPIKASHLSVTDFEQLMHLVAALHGASVVQGLAQGRTEMDVDAFEKWAVKADLLGSMDKLFACFLRQERR